MKKTKTYHPSTIFNYYLKGGGEIMKNISYALLLSIFLLLHGHVCRAEQGIIIVPVADLVGSPIKAFNLAKTVDQSYANLPLCHGSNAPTKNCPRLQQLLFNEIVEIIDKQNNEYCITIPHLFYITATCKTPQNMYWIQSKNVMPVKKLQHHGINLDLFPSMPSYTNEALASSLKAGISARNSAIAIDPPSHKATARFLSPLATANKTNGSDRMTIALLDPFYDPVTKKTYSAGTRFLSNGQEVDPDFYSAYIFDTADHSIKVTQIPKKSAVVQKKQSMQEAMRLFVSILHHWAHAKNCMIPYVWGGASFIHGCKENSFSEVTNKKLCYFSRPDCAECVKTGFDCAGMVARAAQIAGIPYYYKNTYTLHQYLKPLQEAQSLTNGDLIWIPGHVMVVSDIKRNLLIEARGYPHGYGIVHEIALEKVFKNIKNYKQLMDLYFAKGSLERLDCKNQAVETISKFALLKMESAWQNPL
jgi:cell wall-associated NlpC family hydrolase